jgi:hypothetical protein
MSVVTFHQLLFFSFQEFVLAQEKKIEFDRVSDEAKDLLAEIEEATAVQLTPKVSFPLKLYFSFYP